MSSGQPIVGVGAIVVQNDRLLMVRRGRDPARGLWSLPGGRVEHGETLEAAVRREVKEETGLDVDVTGFAGVFEVTGEQHYVILDYFARPEAEQAPTAGSDADEVRWVPIVGLEEMDCTPRLVETLSKWDVIPASAGNKPADA